MATAPSLTAEELEALRQFDTCMIANAIETFNVRLRNTGFTNGKIRCMFPEERPMVGYAVTARLRSGDPPIAGGGYHDRGDLWNFILKYPAPRILAPGYRRQARTRSVHRGHARSHSQKPGLHRSCD